jgi:hypothetical protein
LGKNKKIKDDEVGGKFPPIKKKKGGKKKPKGKKKGK